jgi:FkbM family methyltransferase
MTSRDLINRLVGPLGIRLEKAEKDRPAGRNLHTDLDIILGKKPGCLIFDLGGNEGQSIRHFLKDFREPSIVSFEPGRKNLELLKKKFGAHPRVRIVPAAAGEKDGQGELNVYEHSEMNSLLPLEPGLESVDADLQVVAREPVTIRSLDSFAAENNLNHIDILKIDCQGSELSILRGAKRLLTEERVKCLYLEVLFKPLYQTQAGLGDYVRFLEPHGFDLTGFYKPALRGTALFHCDVLFTRREGPAAVSPTLL